MEARKKSFFLNMYHHHSAALRHVGRREEASSLPLPSANQEEEA
jgi:hypothetical protein